MTSEPSADYALEIFKIDEAVAWLTKHTARTWTASEFLDHCRQNQIVLHASPNLDQQASVIRAVAGAEEVVGKLGWSKLPPAGLHSIHLWQLQMVGEAEVRVPGHNGSNAVLLPDGSIEFTVFDPPIRVRQHNVRVMRDSLLKALDCWRTPPERQRRRRAIESRSPTDAIVAGIGNAAASEPRSLESVQPALRPKVEPIRAERIQAVLRQLGYDPLKLPASTGKVDPAKDAARKLLVPKEMTIGQFKKAWVVMRKVRG